MVGIEGDNELTETFAPTELSEHQGEQLIPTGEVFHIPVAGVLRGEAIELVSVEKRG
jgi:hypothetical protein